MGYHSSFVDEEGVSKACGCPLLPLKSHINEPDSDAEQEDATSDIVDEAITFFRANIFFKNFDYKSSADKLLIYLTLYINLALKRLEGCRTLAEGKKSIINLGLEKIVIPGEAGFPFPGLFASPQSQQEAGKFSRNYQSLPTAHARARHKQAPFNFGAKIILQLPNLVPAHMPAMCAFLSSLRFPLRSNVMSCRPCPTLDLQTCLAMTMSGLQFCLALACPTFVMP
ncbi:hypothetical protein RDI58_004014 [Solanum bulbocastanum]|uniref:Actin-related protein 2/3 complex subunit 3 n=1 Tax=Solanum bulbocastanum TaxID=147425 RepID=A0AAN8U4M0_SOLBU